MNITLPILQTYDDVSKWTGWHKRTIQRKVAQKCFPCHRFSRTDVRFNANDILHYIEGKKEGDFSEKGAL